jgi:anti-sigma B factor antagonist
MRIEQHTTSQVLILKLIQARVDLETAAVLKTRLRESIAAGATRVLLDLDAVSFIDSSGLGAIISALKALGGAGGLAISGAHGSVRDTLRLTRMDRIVPVVETEAEGVAELMRA